MSNSAWITVAGGGSGSGNVTYSVTAYTSSGSRQGTVTIANSLFTVTQGGLCSYSLDQTYKTVGSLLQGGFVYLTTTCSWTAVSNSSWLTVTSITSGTGSYPITWLADVNPDSQPRSGKITIADQTFNLTQLGTTPPVQHVSATSGANGDFTFLIRDPFNYQSIVYTKNVFTASATAPGTNYCYVSLYRPSNQAALADDSGNEYPYVPLGTGGPPLRNSQCMLDLANTRTVYDSAYPRDLTFIERLSFRPGFAGLKNIFMTTTAGVTIPWEQKATYTVFTTPNETPSTISASPASGPAVVDTPRSFTFKFSDPNGSADIRLADVIINSTLSTNPACYVRIYEALLTNTLKLANDQAAPGDAGWSSKITPGTPVTVSNSQCLLDLGASSVTPNINELTIVLSVKFMPGFVGMKNIYMLGADFMDWNSGWQTMGTVNVVSNATFTISGQVTSGGTGLSGVTMTLSGSAAQTTTTNSSGNYSFAGLTAGANYRVTPSKSGYSFGPTSYIEYSNLSANQSANFTATAAASYTLIASPTSVAPGANLSVAFTAPQGSAANDWIALYAVGAPNTSYISYQFTGGATGGTKTYVAPSQAGQYEFRYLTNNQYVSVATSNAITVTGVTHTLAATPANVAPAGTITVTFTAPTGSSTSDWIAMYAVGAPNTSYLAYQYTAGATSGTKGFTAPSQNGQYEFRYLLNGGYTSVKTSNIVTVGSSPYSLAASPTSVVPGANVTVTWTAPSGSSTSDWIAMYATGAPNTTYQAYQFTGGATSGTTTFVAPAQAGTYEFRYLLNNQYNSVITSNSFIVTAASHTLTASPSSVSPGGAITVNFTAPAGSASNDWIALYAVGAGNTSYLAYQYTAGATSGTKTYTAPTQSGQYEFRYLLNGGYTSVKTSNTVTVP